MIAEERKDLIDRRQLYQSITEKIKEGTLDISLHSTLTFKEMLEIFNELPTQSELEAKWIPKKDDYYCSWCTMSAPRGNFNIVVRSSYCPWCGRRMRN